MTPEERQAIRRVRVEETFQLDPQVSINLKGKKYTLEMNNWSVKGFYKESQINIMKGEMTSEKFQDAEIMGVLLRWALATNHPEVSQDEVDKLFTYRHYAYILGQLRQSIDLFLPDMSDIDAKMAQEELEAKANEPQEDDKVLDPFVKPTPIGLVTTLPE